VSAPLPTYGFLPFLRQGLATRITGAAGVRASISVELEVAADAAAPQPLPARSVALYGPGDVTGVEQRAIVRTEPRPGAANFEPNYLAFVEFYDEDFPWRYTPLAPAGRRLTPWLTLLVLKDGEFTEVPRGDAPLDAIDVTDLALFPPKDELWAWAHVHTSTDIRPAAAMVDADGAAVAEALAATTRANPDLACARLIGPRRLQPNQGYTAFVIPSFESGRLAGLKLDPAKAPNAGHIAWDAQNHPDRASLSPTVYPYVHRWSFRTGAQGDFEYLVRLLQPRPVDPEVGVRDIDVQRPSVHVAGIVSPPTLKFAGALRAPLLPEQVTAQDAWADPRPHPFQRTLADLVNLSDSYEATPAAQANAGYADNARALAQANAEITAPAALDTIDDDEPDPVITPPLYGRWHAGVRRLLTLRNGTAAPDTASWVHELNLDPRWRSAAGFGAQVIQARQEALMADAWAQVGALPDANRRIRGGQFALEVAAAWHLASFAPFSVKDPARALMLTAPVHLRVMSGGATVGMQVAASRTPETLFSAPMRRALRPRARLARKLGFTPADPPQRAITRVDDGEIPAVPPKLPPSQPPKVDAPLDALPPAVPPLLAPVARWLATLPLWLLILLLLVLLVLLLLGGLLGTSAAALASAFTGALLWLRTLGVVLTVRDGLREDARRPSSVDRLPPAPSFQLIEQPGALPPPAAGGSSGDSADARRFKEALRTAFGDDEALRGEGRIAPRPALGLRATAAVVTATLDPRGSVPARTLHDIAIPPRWRGQGAEQFEEIMNYPVSDTPMYQPLKELSADHLLPNMHLIPPNSVTLLETNQKFIESYMVGLNHEFARELLWREYPTDQRGSCFRQFWDVSAYHDPNAADPDAQREALRDVPPIHRWQRDSRLGEHDQREEPGGAQRDDLVLTIRGELMRKYPTANVYAHKAAWATVNGRIDRSRERLLAPLDASEAAKPPRTKVKTPLYKASASDDVFLYGFDLTVDEARGDPTRDDRPGWYFVIEERAGDPRFGLDDSAAGAQPQLWSDLAWGQVPAGTHLTIGAGVPLRTSAPPDTGEAEDAARRTQWEEDRQVPWGPASDAADIAYVLYQTPMRVAIHAADMLPRRSLA